jgi:hypothetical protein
MSVAASLQTHRVVVLAAKGPAQWSASYSGRDLIEDILGNRKKDAPQTSAVDNRVMGRAGQAQRQSP